MKTGHGNKDRKALRNNKAIKPELQRPTMNSFGLVGVSPDAFVRLEHQSGPPPRERHKYRLPHVSILGPKPTDDGECDEHLPEDLLT
jgi:hypothetical protein